MKMRGVLPLMRCVHKTLARMPSFCLILWMSLRDLRFISTGISTLPGLSSTPDMLPSCRNSRRTNCLTDLSRGTTVQLLESAVRSMRFFPDQ